MNSAPLHTTAEIAKRRRAVLCEIARLKEELEDLTDSLDLLAARKRNAGKPTYTHEEICKRFGLKP